MTKRFDDFSAPEFDVEAIVDTEDCKLEVLVKGEPEPGKLRPPVAKFRLSPEAVADVLAFVKRYGGKG